MITGGVAAALILHGKSVEKKAAIEKKLDRAEQYLDDLEYDRAIAAYKAVLELDPGNEDAIDGLEEICATVEDNDPSLAEEIYEEVISLLERSGRRTGDRKVAERYEDLAGDLEERLEDVRKYSAAAAVAAAPDPDELSEITDAGYAAATIDTPAVDPSGSAAASNTTAYGQEGPVLHIYCWNEEFKNILERHYPGYSSSGKIGDTEVKWTIIPTADEAYQNALDMALMNNTYSDEGDIVDIFLVEPDYSLKYTDSQYSLPLEQLGIDEAELSGQFDFVKNFSTDRQGYRKGVCWNCCVGGMIYNREIAKEVLGSDDPAVVQAAVEDWGAFKNTADLMNKAGYRMTATAEDTYRVFFDNMSGPWVDDGRIRIDDHVKDWVDLSEYMLDKGETTNEYMWSDSWMQGFYTGDVFCYFGPSWLFYWCMSGDVADRGGWAVTEGPEPFYWGGTCLMAAVGTDNPRLVADIFRCITMDDGIMYDIMLDNQDCVNNRYVLSNAARDSAFNVDILGGQNPFEALLHNAERIDNGGRMTIYDQDLCAGYSYYMGDYFRGFTSYDEALEEFYRVSEQDFPELSH